MDDQRLESDKKLFIRLFNTILFVLWLFSQDLCVQFIKSLLGQKAEETIFGFPIALQILSSVIFCIMSVFCTDEYNKIIESLIKSPWKLIVVEILFCLCEKLYKILVYLFMFVPKFLFAVLENKDGIKTADETHRSIIQEYEKSNKKMQALSIGFALSGLLYLIAFIMEHGSHPEVLQYYSKAISLCVSLVGFLSIIRSSTTTIINQRNISEE